MKGILDSHFFFWADKRKSREFEGGPDVRRFAALRRFLPLCAIFRGTPLKNRANSPFSATLVAQGEKVKSVVLTFSRDVLFTKSFLTYKRKSREIIDIPADSGKSHCPRECFIREKIGKSISLLMFQFWGNVCRKKERFFSATKRRRKKWQRRGGFSLSGQGSAGTITLPCTKVREGGNFFDKNSKKPCINTGDRV